MPLSHGFKAFLMAFLLHCLASLEVGEQLYFSHTSENARTNRKKTNLVYKE